MKLLCRDLLAEYEDLAALTRELTDKEWAQETAFHSWTPWDEVAHLCYFDETSLLALSSESEFLQHAKDLLRSWAEGREISDLAREKYGHLAGHELVVRWREAFRKEVAALVGLDPRSRIPWYGPSMSARSFATARLMETWAHGQDIYDLLRRRRPVGPALRHIAHLGVTTYDWSFLNRGLKSPGPAPYVELHSSTGDVWRWGDPSESDFIVGDAAEFVLLVTQRRHVLDTNLSVAGDAARAWAEIAQCFAGPPADGPAPGRRKVEY